MDWLGFLPVILRSSTSHPRLNPLPASGRITSCTDNEYPVLGRLMNQRIRTAALTTILATLLSGISTSTVAQSRTPIDVAALGPQVGERVPDFSLPDQNGQIQTLDSIRGPNGTMLLFHRSADW